MHIDITGRQLEITPALKDFTRDKLRKLGRLLEEPLEVKVVLGIEKHRHTAEILVKSRSGTFTGAQETGDLYASIGEVADKLERQALKHKEKLQSHKHRKSQRDPVVAAAIGAHAAENAVGGPGADAAVAQDEEGPKIFRSKSYRLKPLSAEDAALELEGTGENFIVFRESETDHLCVLYRQNDGNYGLIEPEW